MLAYQGIVFDDIVPVAGSAGAAPYSDARFDRVNGSIEIRAYQIVASLIGATATALTVQIEHSSDGRTWIPRSGTPEVNAVTLAANNQFYISVDDGRAIPMGGFVRLKLTVNNGTAVAKVYVVGRTRRPGKTGPIPMDADCGCKGA